MGITAWPETIGGVPVEVQSWGETGFAYKGYPWRLVIHSTETGTWPGYLSGKNQPHVTWMWSTLTKRWMVRQHQSLNIGARALLGISTNTANALQVEIVGTCDKAFADKYGYLYLPALTAEQKRGLGVLIVGLARIADIDTSNIALGAPYPKSYGNGPYRMSQATWLKFPGLCQHQNVAQNSHGDAGALDVKGCVAAGLVALGGGVSRDEDRKPPKKPAKSKYSRHGLTAAEVKSVQRALNDNFDAHLVVDGSYGPNTTAGVKAAQREMGLTGKAVDGIWGDDTQAAYVKWKAEHKPPVRVGVKHKIAVDGRWGAQTTEQLQRHFGTPVDGIISSQPDWNLPITGLEVVKKPKGSTLVRAIQKAVGAPVDGKLGPDTIKAIQRHFGTPADGVISEPRSAMVVAMQTALNHDDF